MARRNLSIILILSIICNVFFIHYLVRRDADESGSDLMAALADRANRIDVENVKKREADQQPRHTLAPQIDSYLNQKLIFIVGAMSSGTTLMRLILDVHPDVNCGDETKIVHLMLEFVNSVYRDRFYVQFMNNSGVRNETIDKATALFVYYMMENNKKNPDVDMSAVKYLCNKEPMNTFQMAYIHRLFPFARFVYVVRDGRDVAYSLMRRNRQAFTFERFFEILSYWNTKNVYASNTCAQMGPSFCHMVKYEDLVTQPETSIRLITEFLELEWTDELLHHDRYLESKNISLSSEPIFSGLQKNEINNQSVGKWRDNVPNYNEQLIGEKIFMLKEFNYF